ncbi:MAG: CheR family methyltransferase [Chloroflexota bacterium]
MAFTYFFRDRDVLDLVVQHALPELRTRLYINVWDAGCAMGPEPYSLAILLRENMGRFMFRNVRIYATDIDESSQFGEVIARGVYAEQDIKRIPADIRARYFTRLAGNGHFQIAEEIRKAVRFQQHDLCTLQPPRVGFGLIVCKNVLLHLAPEVRVAVLQMFHAALADGGYLVTEQTQKLPSEIEPLFRQVTQAGQLFQKGE